MAAKIGSGLNEGGTFPEHDWQDVMWDINLRGTLTVLRQGGVGHVCRRCHTFAMTESQKRGRPDDPPCIEVKPVVEDVPLVVADALAEAGRNLPPCTTLHFDCMDGETCPRCDTVVKRDTLGREVAAVITADPSTCDFCRKGSKVRYEDGREVDFGPHPHEPVH